MLMNSIILKDQSGLINDPVTLAHLHNTLKSKIGDKLKCTVLNVGLTQAHIVSISAHFCELKLGPIQPGAKQWVDLVVGLSRPQTSKKILEHATTFGVRKIHFYKAALSEKSYLASKIFEAQAYEEFLINGLSQSALYDRLPEFKLDKYNPAAQYKNEAQKFVLDLNGKTSFLNSPIDFEKPITIAIGPERGFISEDLEHFHSSGFESIKISSSILRVEHAVYCAFSQLELLRNKF